MHPAGRLDPPAGDPAVAGPEEVRVENLTERLVVFTAAPGSEDAERLALLDVVGAQGFQTEAGLAGGQPLRGSA